MNSSEEYNSRDIRIKKYEKLVKPNKLINSINLLKRQIK